MTIMICLFTEEDPDGYVRVFRSEYILPEVEEFLGEFFIDGSFVSVCQWSKPPCASRVLCETRCRCCHQTKEMTRTR